MAMRGPKPKPFECPEPVFWYLVGVVASDGCLCSDGRHVTIVAKDRDYLSQLKRQTGVSCSITKCYGSSGQLAHRLQISSRVLYDLLIAVGLTPRKSLTIGPLLVPDQFFRDFLRGVIDGDGNIRRWVHPTNARQQWTARIVSASKPFLQWIGHTVTQIWQVSGALHEERRKPPHHSLYTLKFGKLAAKVILCACYYPGAIALERKRQLAEECVATSVGWSRSKTVRDSSQWRNWTYRHVWEKQNNVIDGQDADPTAGLACDNGWLLGEPGWRNLAKRARLKILCPERGVWVRLPPPASSLHR